MSNRKNRWRAGRRAVKRALVAAACMVGLAAVAPAANAANGVTYEQFKVVRIPPTDPTPAFSSWFTSPGTETESVASGPDGNIWYTEVSTPAGDDWRVGRLTFAGQGAGPEGSILNVFNGIDDVGPAPHGDLFGITTGPDSNL